MRRAIGEDSVARTPTVAFLHSSILEQDICRIGCPFAKTQKADDHGRNHSVIVHAPEARSRLTGALAAIGQPLCLFRLRAFLRRQESIFHHEIETNKECFRGFPFSKLQDVLDDAVGERGFRQSI
jgi:hypothetical protein